LGAWLRGDDRDEKSRVMLVSRQLLIVVMREKQLTMDN
jgi:hypothetical protein